ncbi:unnamed protein product [Ectocarpus sp. 8 AP-2014]
MDMTPSKSWGTPFSALSRLRSKLRKVASQLTTGWPPPPPPHGKIRHVRTNSANIQHLVRRPLPANAMTRRARSAPRIPFASPPPIRYTFYDERGGGGYPLPSTVTTHLQQQQQQQQQLQHLARVAISRHATALLPSPRLPPQQQHTQQQQRRASKEPTPPADS